MSFLCLFVYDTLMTVWSPPPLPYGAQPISYQSHLCTCPSVRPYLGGLFFLYLALCFFFHPHVALVLDDHLSFLRTARPVLISLSRTILILLRKYVAQSNTRIFLSTRIPSCSKVTHHNNSNFQNRTAGMSCPFHVFQRREVIARGRPRDPSVFRHTTLQLPQLSGIIS
jgi:hypothetical protein